MNNNQENNKPSISLWHQMLWVISTKPDQEYPILGESCGPLKDLLLESELSPSGFHLISSTRAWWASKATASGEPRT